MTAFAVDANSEVEMITVLAGLFQSQLDLPDDRCWIYNQKIDIRPDKGVFIDVGFIGERVIGNNRQYVSTTAGLNEIIGTVVQETYSATIFSYDASARRRKFEMAMALTSTQCQQLAEKYCFSVGYIPTTFVDVSAVEASARLNRYEMTFNVTRRYELTRTVEYFDNFELAVPPEVHTEP